MPSAVHSQTINVVVVAALVEWEDSVRSLPVLAKDSDPLFGMSVLYGGRLTIHVIDGGSVGIDLLR